MIDPSSVTAPLLSKESAAARVAVEETRRARFSLRARDDLSPLDTALGLTLPRRIGSRADADGGHVQALALGPDEWVLQAPPATADHIAAACGAVYAERPHSLVDVSDRETTFRIEGPRAVDLLTLGCPRDLDGISVGEGRRTVFDDVAVVLWRDGERRFRLDVWRSFAPHVFGLLAKGCDELAAETPPA